MVYYRARSPFTVALCICVVFSYCEFAIPNLQGFTGKLSCYPSGIQHAISLCSLTHNSLTHTLSWWLTWAFAAISSSTTLRWASLAATMRGEDPSYVQKHLEEVGMANETTKKQHKQVCGWLNTMNEQSCMTCSAHLLTYACTSLPTLFVHCIEPSVIM